MKKFSITVDNVPDGSRVSISRGDIHQVANNVKGGSAEFHFTSPPKFALVTVSITTFKKGNYYDRF